MSIRENNKLSEEIDVSNLMFIDEVLTAFKGISRSELYRMIKLERAPKPVMKHKKKSVWRKDQIEDAIKNHFSAAF